MRTGLGGRLRCRHLQAHRLRIRGKNVFKGYWRQPEKTAGAFEKGWFKSGDLGYLDPHDAHRLYLVGRSKELIISGGYNVYPKEVENAIEDHDAILEAAVYWVKDSDLGEKVVAAVVIREGRSIGSKEIIEYCKKHLAKYKCPKEIHFIRELPKNAMGKIQNHLLQSREP